MTRSVLLAQILNNRDSVPPLSVRLVQAAPLQKGAALAAGQLALVGSGGAGGYTYSATGLPAGLSLDTATGAITGTPTAYGHNVITATVTDSATTTSPAATFSVEVPIPLYGIDVTPPNCEEGFGYSYQLSIGGATGTVTYSLTSGSLAGNLTVSTGGLISGVPTLFSGGSGLHSCVITASDSGTGATLPILISFSCGFYTTAGSPPAYTITTGVETTVANGQFGGEKPIVYQTNLFSSTTNGAVGVTM